MTGTEDDWDRVCGLVRDQLAPFGWDVRLVTTDHCVEFRFELPARGGRLAGRVFGRAMSYPPRHLRSTRMPPGQWAANMANIVMHDTMIAIRAVLDKEANGCQS